MGAALFGGPVTSKDSGDGVDKKRRLAWGYSSMQGWRPRMEDAHFCVSNLASCASRARRNEWAGTSVFGVFDGHGGDQVSLFCKSRMPAAIASSPARDVPGALTAAFHRMDEMLQDPARNEDLPILEQAWSALQESPVHSGCTAVVCCVQRESIVVANAGDSRAVLCRGGKAVALSEDHKPNLPKELARIGKAGGHVTAQKIPNGTTIYRVNGNLNLSRSIGDLAYKMQTERPVEQQIICSTPDVQTMRRQADDEFLVVACDGVWDVMSNQEVVDFIRPHIGAAREAKLSPVLESLLDHCISPDLDQTSGLGGDNMTIVVVQLLREDALSSGSDIGDGAVMSSWFCASG